MSGDWFTCTADIDMTPSQEKSLAFALDRLRHNNFCDRHNVGGVRFSRYGFRDFKVRHVGLDRAIQLSVLIDNGRPGTVGYEYPVHACFFIGPRGNIHGFREPKRKTKTGRSVRVAGSTALIYCTKTY